MEDAPANAPPREIGDLPSLARARRTAELFAEHGPLLRGVARRYSGSAEDAEDALQRTAEIVLRRSPDAGAGRLLAWARVVLRHEAFAVARERRRLPLNAAAPDGGAGPSSAERIAASGPDPLAVLEARERVAEAAGTLRRLKQPERRALALQAAGCSYAEIQAITGWTYTKVNRCLAEGRAALRESRVAADDVS